MNFFDAAILHWINTFVGRWPRFDQFVSMMQNLTLAKGALLTALIWYAWFSGRPLAREKTLCRLSESLAGLTIARLIADLAPSRARPMFESELNFRVPGGTGLYGFMQWSAFPSDHAALYVALATGICLVSWRLGLIALIWTTLIVLFPRLYVGAHHP